MSPDEIGRIGRPSYAYGNGASDQDEHSEFDTNAQMVNTGGLAYFQGSDAFSNQDVAVNAISMIVDIVFLIDGTGSMQKIMDEMKNNALALYERTATAFKDKQKRTMESMRVKVIIYRDIYVDAVPFVESEFFVLPKQVDEFKAFIASIRASGGGDEPESGLEALAKGMKSSFLPVGGGRKGRHILFVMTDASAHRLDDPQRSIDPAQMYPSMASYDTPMPKNLEKLQDIWEGMEMTAKRLCMIAPNVYPWTDINSWTQTSFTAARQGMSDTSFNAIIAAIEGSL